MTDLADIPPPATRTASAVGRALDGLSLAPHDHVASLAAQAQRCLEARHGLPAWLLAERLARLRSGLVPDDLVLRALALATLKDSEGARRDILDAAAIEPGHAMANRLLLASADTAERGQAARRLLRSAQGSALRREALRVLAAENVQVAGSFEGTAAGIQGWVAWQGSPTLECCLVSGQGQVRHHVHVQAGHPMAGVFAHAAAVAWPWPPDADAVAVTCDEANSVLQPQRLWRPDEPQASSGPRRTVGVPDAGGRKVAVIVPVYDDHEATKTCLESLLKHPEAAVTRRIIVIDDVTPDPAIAALLDGLARQGVIVLLRNAVNLGFAASVNRGLAMLEPDEDALLLNADTVAPSGLCARVARVAYRHDDIATVTPLSNNGEYTSLPVRFRENPLPPLETLTALDRLAADLGGGEPVTLPNGIGFCLYVKRAALDTVGPLSLQFGRGYGEDIEFCLRATAAGFRHVCASDVVVGHAGSRSFRSEKRALVVDNLVRIGRLYPSYRRDSSRFVRVDPLKTVIGRVEWGWLLARSTPFAVVVCAREHDATLIDRYAAVQRAAGLDTLVAILDPLSTGVSLRLRDQAGSLPQNISLTYGTATAADELMRDLVRLPVATLAVMDPGNLPAWFVPAITKAGLAYDALLADALAARRDLADARKLIVATARLGRGLGSAASAEMTVLPDDNREPAVRVTRRDGSGILLIMCNDASAGDAELIRRLAADLRQADPDAAILVDGAVEDDLDVMALRNIFVLGRAPAGQHPRRDYPVAVSGIVFPSRRWGMSDTRIDAMGPMPVACFDQAADAGAVAGRNLHLSLQESVPSASARIVQWWLALTPAGADRHSPG